MLAVGRTIVTASIDIFTGCKIANRIAGRDRVRHPPPMPNCTNWLAPGFNIDSRSRQAQFYQSPNCPRPIFEPWLSKVNDR
jgi:hypothetical protein